MTKAAVALLLLISIGTATAKPRKKPVLTFDPPKVTGAIDADAVTKALERNKRKLFACYDKAYGKVAELEGSVSEDVTFTIGADGKATYSGPVEPGDALHAC